MNQSILKSGLLLASLLAIAGCEGDNNNNNNNNGTQKICTADTKECVDSKHLRICSKEGAEWYNITCDSGETCEAGACKKDPVEEPTVLVCFPGDGKCMPGTPDKSLVCNSTGTGFNATDCPADTACVGAGVCVGVCAVGSSICLDGKTLATCTNGTGYTTTTCSATQGCVTTGDTPFDTAACKTNECDPPLDGCAFVCGNKTDATADQTKFVSLCIETPDGWRWTALGCAANELCDSQGGDLCAGGLKRDAACSAECNNGDSFCNAAGELVTCNNGTFGTGTACATGKTCFASPTNPNAALCGDPACAFGGACTADGKIRTCDASGNLAATGTDCVSGLCTQAGPAGDDGIIPGKCVDLCKDGETRCVGDAGLSITFETCTMGRWTTLSNCTSGFCFNSPTNDGRASTLCGECEPKAGECGETQSDGRRPVRFCGANGMWGTFTDCTLGTCDDDNANDVRCVADCVPNAKVCRGALADSIYVARLREGTCTDKGLFPDTSTACTGGQTCRIDVAGNALGCVDCVYNNEFGLIDSRCVDVDGDDGLQFCTSTNTWGTATSCGGGDLVCTDPFEPFYDAPIVYAAPAPTDRSYCHACTFEDNDGNTIIIPECRLSVLQGYGFTYCDDVFFGDFSDPMICGSRFGSTATVNDCCDLACSKDSFDNAPTPAFCSID